MAINEHINNGQSVNGHSSSTNGCTNGNGYTNVSGNSQVNGNIRNGINDHTQPSINGRSSSGQNTPEPIAICGLSMRLPGGIRDAETFWDVLSNGKDMRGPIPPNRYNAKGFDNSLGNKGAIKTQYGYFLDEDLSHLDTSFFSMSKSELEKADPQQRQLLEITRECLENAGEVNYRGKMIGCYVGTFGEDWLHMFGKDNQNTGGYILSGHGDLMIANRVSFEFDLQGPSMVIKTGCSASLVGLHEACRALHSGDCTGAIVAGTSLIMGPTTTAAMTLEGVLSPNGSCKSFDSAADGFARGEAIVSVYVKRLDDAIRDENPIRAIIRNTGTNSDGRSQGLMAPNGKAHEALMRKVYRDAGLDPGHTGFVECHGTGTATGDPIEVNAVGNVFGDKGVFIGSVKPNIGHTEGASGIVSLIKAVLALEKATIPPNIKFVNPNPKIPFAEKRLQVPLTPQPWPKDRAERISINSFGIGGTNVHVIVDSLIECRPDLIPRAEDRNPTTPVILPFSANTQESLRRLVDNSREYLDRHQERLPDLAYTLSRRREHLPHRAFSVVTDRVISNVSPFAKAAANALNLVMIFTGQGAQWPQMGRELIEGDEKVRRDIQAMDEVLAGLKYPPSWSIEEELLKPAETSQIHRAELSQPVCTAIQIAITNALGRSGIRPKAVIGHSSGEIGAAYAVGALSFTEAIIVAYYRGYVTKFQHLVGGMAAVGLDAKTTSTMLTEGVVVACENSPDSTTISGDLDQLEKVIAKIKKQHPDVLARQLKVDMAYHSHHMKPLSTRYLDLLQEELRGKPRIHSTPDQIYYSTVTGSALQDTDNLDPTYWTSNLTFPVRFSSAVQSLLHHNRNNIFLEIGPHSALAGPLRQICAEEGSPCLYVPSMLRSKNCAETLLSAYGQLYQHGVSLDFAVLHPHGTVLNDLPSYPWDHSASFWYESRLSKDWRHREFGHHALLGLRVLETPDLAPCWRNVLVLEDEPWLNDHKVKQDVVFPFAGYVAMAGEAVRQISGIDTGYSLRHVVAHTALLLNDSKPAELVTALRRHRLTDSAETDTYDFVVSSFSGSTWIKHCEGRVKPLPNSASSSYKPSKLPRKVSTARWYDVMADVGIVYGPEFQGLSKVTSSTSEQLAAATIENPEVHQNASFLFHPAAIDTCFQLILVAVAKGIGRNFPQLSVPTLIEELDIYRSTTSMDATAWSHQGKGETGVECVSNGVTALRLRGFHLTSIDDERASSTFDRHAGARLVWQPDFDFLDISSFLTPPKVDQADTLLLEELALLCMMESSDRLEGLSTSQPHFYKFRDWLKMEISRAEIGTYPLVEDAGDYAKLSRPARLAAIEEKYSQLRSTSRAAVATGIYRILDNAGAIFTGKIDTLNVLMEDDILTEIYNAVSFGHSDFVRMLAHTKPNLRILEVGAGTGGTTELILRNLVNPDAHPAYSTYTFTDISAGFFPQAKQRFAYAPNMEYKVFDISQSPFDQGFEAESYDLILAPNVVHATANLHNTLVNLRPLLRPHGLFVLTEICAVVRAPNYIFGNFSGWWLGEEDGRPYEPYVPVERWDKELKDVGFTGADVVVYDAPQPYGFCAAIISQPQQSDVEYSEKVITLLSDKPEEGVGRILRKDFENAGFQVTISNLENASQQDHAIVSVLDLESAFLDNITEERFTAFQKMLRHHKSQDILWLTKPAQIHCHEVGATQTIGMARGVRSELNIPLVTLEIDPTESKFSELVLGVFEKVRTHKDTENLGPDREYAVRDGVVMLGRYQPFSLTKELKNNAVTSSHCAKTLKITKPGLLESLSWAEERQPAGVLDGQVEVEVRAVGMNFRDIVYAMGIISPDTNNVPLGVELAGIIRRVGPDVRNFIPGDRILALAPDGCMTTDLILPAPLAVKIPDSLSLEDAATMPACFATVIESLLNVGRLEKGQSVLIHSAAGGVGHAAIQICRMIGAEIYATVGTEEKVQYLISNFSIPRDHIFHSRDDSFVDGVKRATNGRGVDIVLNSLSGELLHASWKCVAEFGKLVEIGKRDLVGHGKLDMYTFLANRSYCCVDIAQYIRDRPETTGRMLMKTLDLYRLGHVHSLRPLTVFKAADIEQGFRYLQNGDHIGKAVVSMPENPSEISATAQTPSVTFDPDAAYLLVGGLGGLGRSLATWMVEHGARSLIFLSRSAEGAENKEFFEDLTSMRCSVTAVAGNVHVMADVERAISTATKPIKGVFQLAMVLRDAPFIDMSYSDWMTTIKPKVDGTWNLHKALLSQPLDYFWMASSLVTLVNQPGQANYNAANTFLEAFCQYRHLLGLPASVLSICPIEGVGFVAENPHAKRNVKAQGLYLLGEREFLDFVELSLFNSGPSYGESKVDSSSWESKGHLIMGLHSEIHLDDANNRTNWRRDRRMGTYHNIQDATDAAGDGSANSSQLRDFLNSATADPDMLRQSSSEEYLAHEIGRRVFNFMLKPEEDVDISLGLSQIGLDSLMAIELRRWWKQTFGLEISVLEIMGIGTIRELGGMAAEGVRKKLEGRA
ncbi:putative polyketide synthase [Glonium stellatum]|uniref:Putative polyketide synthase n=1 Tax=Glonium stellatum TaxID=574774 RepID=A0A8E2EQF4_9PEZI|nr:putative polyketide synthase [Glonium stellatum]